MKKISNAVDTGFIYSEEICDIPLQPLKALLNLMPRPLFGVDQQTPFSNFATIAAVLHCLAPLMKLFEMEVVL